MDFAPDQLVNYNLIRILASALLLLLAPDFGVKTLRKRSLVFAVNE